LPSVPETYCPIVVVVARVVTVGCFRDLFDREPGVDEGALWSSLTPQSKTRDVFV